MKRRLFIDADTPPTEALLRKQLGKAMEYYSAILHVSVTTASNGSTAVETAGS